MVIPKEESEKEITGIDSTIALIATPMLTGPGTISFITIKSYDIGRTAVLFNLCASFLLVGAVFLLFSFLVSKVNEKLVNIVSRILGLFLMAVAVEMITKGFQVMITTIL